MGKIFCCLLAAMLTLGAFSGCKKQATPPTDETREKQANGTGAAQTESTGATKPGNTEVTQPDPTEATQPENKEETATEPQEEVYESLYKIREITDYRVKIENNQKIYNDGSFFSLIFPVDWKCLEQQGEDGRSHFFRDPVLNEKCQLSISVTGAEYLYERTPEQYRESLLSRPLQDLVIDSIAEETFQGYKCMKLVYSYTENDTKFIKISYNNVVAGLRLYSFSIIYPADQKDTYEPIFAWMIHSLTLKSYTR